MPRTHSRPVRQRNAAATRAAILQSARKTFAKLGYGAGVREIASGAGVTAMLVNRYFGSKEQLFAEAVTESMTRTTVLGPEIAKAGGTSGESIAALLVGITQADDTPLEGFQIMLRSASDPRAARIARKLIERHHQSRIAGALKGDLAAQRAGVMLALIAGFQAMRQMIELPALAKSDPKTLVKVLGPIFDQLLATSPRR
jgi:AcrR family transcriptional regulator